MTIRNLPRLVGSTAGFREKFTPTDIAIPSFDGGLCDMRNGHDPELWFRTDTADRNDPRHPALALCAACPVQNECLTYALEEDIRDGIWGGTFPHQRAYIVRRRRKETR